MFYGGRRLFLHIEEKGGAQISYENVKLMMKKKFTVRQLAYSGV